MKVSKTQQKYLKGVDKLRIRYYNWCCGYGTNTIPQEGEDKRMNTKALKAQMILKDKSIDQLCAALGISRTAWFRKVGGESQFTQGEIAGLRFELELDDHQTADIFFNKEVS